MYIRLANITDLPEVLDLMRRVVPVMQAMGNFQWDDEYPNEAVFRRDINEHDLFVAILDEQVVGAVAINAFLPPEYQQVQWKSSPNTYTFHRMMVDPDLQGKGIATAILQFIEKRGRNMGLMSLRVDTNENNSIMRSLFDKFNYSYVGTVHFRGLSSDFLCYEKTLF